jgi:CRP/FNR family transcriptional regulator, nitrogen oxide reductase regulator
MILDGGSGPEESSEPNDSPANHDPLTDHLVWMCASSLFKGLSQRECTEVLSSGEVRTFAHNELLFAQGQSMRNLIVLDSGSVELTQLSSSGNEVLLRMNGTGELVNLLEESSTYSARAVELCTVLVWEYERLELLLAQYPQIRNNIIQILSGRIQELEELFRELATEKVAKRLARVLLKLLRQIGKPSTEGILVSLNREELAQMTGTTPYTIGRVLSKWSEQGFITALPESVLISDPKGLEWLWNEDD